VRSAAELYGVSRPTLYRLLQGLLRPRAAHRADRGRPRTIAIETLERYCELVAALKVRSENGKGRRLSTRRAIELLERYGVETPDGLVQAPPGRLKRALSGISCVSGHDGAKEPRHATTQRADDT
jgi:hypothetical protein